MARLSVSDIVTSLSCPRLFWFSKVEGRSSLLDRAAGSGLGSRIHRLLKQFEDAAPSTAELQVALRSRPLSSRAARVLRRLEELLYREVFLPEVTRDHQGGRADGDQALALWDALRTYGRALAPYLEGNSRALPAGEVLRKTLLASELEVRGVLSLANGRNVEVRGRADGLWYDYRKQRAVLLEYKTRPLKPGGEDFLQLALYYWLLEDGNGVEGDARLLPLVEEEAGERAAAGSFLRGPEELRRIRDQGRLEAQVVAMLEWMDWAPSRSGVPAPPGPASTATCEGCPVRAECYRRIPAPVPGAVTIGATPTATSQFLDKPGRSGRSAPSAPLRDPELPAGRRGRAAAEARLVVRLGEDAGGAPIEWYPNDTSVFVNANLAILGTMGTGKTQCTRSILHQLARPEPEAWGAPARILVFDYKGDYRDEDFCRRVGARVLRAEHLPFNPLALPTGPGVRAKGGKQVWNTLSTFSDSLARAMGLGEVQKLRLLELLEETFQERGITDDDPDSWGAVAPSVTEIADAYVGDKSRRKDKLYRVMLELARSELFHPDPEAARRVWDALEGVTVLDLQGRSESLQDLAVATLLDQLYAEMHLRGDAELAGEEGQLRRLRLILLVDEADNFMSKEFPILRRLLKEARSFGVGVILSTQYLRHFATKKERYAEAFSSWIVHQFDGLKDAQIRESFGIHEAAAIREFRARLRARGKHESLALLTVEGEAERRILEMQDLPYYQLVGD